MDRKAERRGLGRGLSALMAELGPGSSSESESASLVRMVPIERIEPNPNQPRKAFPEEALRELAASIERNGILQPLVVRTQGGAFQIVAGERRWRAAQLARFHELPVIIREFTDQEVLEVAIIENIQREELSPIEEAQALHSLIERFGHTQEMVAEAVGKSRSYVANALRLLGLPAEVQQMVMNGEITAGHARALLTVEDPVSLAARAARERLSVRAVEDLARRSKSGATPRKPREEKDADTRALESDLAAQIGCEVLIEHDPRSGGGRIILRYRDLEQLDRICGLLSSTIGAD
ncbi:MAG: ParB/RepB/Spo0J family partition protein [Gemmobacter sp.]